MRAGLTFRSLALVALCGVLGLALLALVTMRSTNLVGDEYTYTKMAQAMGAWIGGRLGGTATLDQVIDTGWFMPGMGVLGAPFYALSDSLPMWLLRLLPMALNLALFLPLVWLAWKNWGRLHALALLFFPGLAFGWHLAATGWWPEIPAGLLAGIALVACWQIGMRILRGEVPGIGWLLVFELALVAALYLRGPTLLLGLGLHLILFALLTAKGVARGRVSLRLVAGLALPALLLLPWSLVMSAHFDRNVLTTTNVPLVLADSFAGQEKACFGSCTPGVDIWPAWNYAQDLAASTGENPLDIQRRMMDFALQDLTVRDYLSQVGEHFGAFLFDPMDRLHYYRDRMYGVPEAWRDPFIALASAVTLVLYVPFLLALLIANVLPFRGNDSTRLQAILLKGATACAFLQPFMHKSSARYWTGFAFLMAWSMALLVLRWRERSAGRDGSAQAVAMPRWLDRMQEIYGAGCVLLAAAILLA